MNLVNSGHLIVGVDGGHDTSNIFSSLFIEKRQACLLESPNGENYQGHDFEVDQFINCEGWSIHVGSSHLALKRHKRLHPPT